ncbi:MAG: sigma-54-dependent Fis family transcriptional regulator, partial [Sedimentisphaerales bacterium]|nr:sigma-54-dependent Fis family transcriptional regulator [Sedimentisphaerales bacterium]
MRILVSWIGHTDLKATLGDLPLGKADKIKAMFSPSVQIPKDGGPIKTLISQEKYDRIYFISSNDKAVTSIYTNWLGVNNVKTTLVKLDDPTDYSEIYTVSSSFLESIFNELGGKVRELSILLSPGTPAMAAVWVLLGKTKYKATFWQTWNGKAKKEKIPFDISLDVVPELLSSSDNIFHRLAEVNPEDVRGFEGIVGNTKAIRIAVGRAQKAAVRDVAVLLTGESGTGKEMFARAIHKASKRHEKPFIALNCAAIPSELLESELFGHKKGAFTGADKDNEGAFKRADGGILFLDEIGECDYKIQAKLLRVLQPQPDRSLCYREFYPVGASKLETADVRVVAATNRNLLDMVEKNLFREDLFYRLAIITVKIPPLRERKNDISKIAELLLNKINNDFGNDDSEYEHKKFSSSTNIFMAKHTWPGNVRELHNTILQAVVMSDKNIIMPEDIKASLTEYSGNSDKDLLGLELGDGFSLESHLNYIQKHYLCRAMQEADGVKTKAAELLGLNSYQTLDAQAKRLGIDFTKNNY